MMTLNGQFSNLYAAFAKIYGLCDIDGNVFYVGCTTIDPFIRLSGHLCEASGKGIWRNKKIDKIKSLNHKVSIKILEIIWITGPRYQEAIKAAHQLETQWMKKLIDEGADLTNKQRKGIEITPEHLFQQDYDTWLNQKNKLYAV